MKRKKLIASIHSNSDSDWDEWIEIEHCLNL